MNDLSMQLCTVPRFTQQLGEQDRYELWRLGRRRYVQKHQYALRAGEPSRCVCIVECGHFKILQPTTDGRELLLFFRGAGEILGLRGALRDMENTPRSFSSQACEDSEILCIPAEQFRAYLLAHPLALFSVTKTLLQRVDDLSDSLSSVTLGQVESRIARLFLCLGNRYGTHVGETISLEVPLTHQEIADMVGAARQTVSVMLNDFKQQGILGIDENRHFHIKDRVRLRHAAFGDAMS